MLSPLPCSQRPPPVETTREQRVRPEFGSMENQILNDFLPPRLLARSNSRKEHVKNTVMRLKCNVTSRINYLFYQLTHFHELKAIKERGKSERGKENKFSWVHWAVSCVGRQGEGPGWSLCIFGDGGGSVATECPRTLCFLQRPCPAPIRR